MRVYLHPAVLTDLSSEHEEETETPDVYEKENLYVTVTGHSSNVAHLALNISVNPSPSQIRIRECECYCCRYAADLCDHPDHSSAPAHPRGLGDVLLPDAEQEVITKNPTRISHSTACAVITLAKCYPNTKAHLAISVTVKQPDDAKQTRMCHFLISPSYRKSPKLQLLSLDTSHVMDYTVWRMSFVVVSVLNVIYIYIGLYMTPHPCYVSRIVICKDVTYIMVHVFFILISLFYCHVSTWAEILMWFLHDSF